MEKEEPVEKPLESAKILKLDEEKEEISEEKEESIEEPEKVEPESPKEESMEIDQ